MGKQESDPEYWREGETYRIGTKGGSLWTATVTAVDRDAEGRPVKIYFKDKFGEARMLDYGDIRDSRIYRKRGGQDGME